MEISVIVAIYNVESYLEYCLESLLNQNFQNVEFILVDDGSTDKSSLICDNAQLSDSRVRVIHKSNGGLSDARNAGLEVATGNYVMFIDGDDVLDRDTLSILNNLAMDTNSDLIQYAYREISKPDMFVTAKFDGIYEIVTDRHDMYMQLYKLGGLAASACTKFIKRDKLQKLRFEKGRLHEDEFFTTELLAIVDSVTYAIGFAPYQYIVRNGSIITSGFNPKRVYDICEMYGRRIKQMTEFGFHDIAELFQTKWFGNLYIQYHKSRLMKENKCTGFIKHQLNVLRPVKSAGLNLEMRVAKGCPNVMLPTLYRLRWMLHKPI